MTDSALVVMETASIGDLIGQITLANSLSVKAEFAQNILLHLGLAAYEAAPPIQEKETLPQYIDRLANSDSESLAHLAHIEALGAGEVRKLQEALEVGVKKTLYTQFVTNRWQYHAARVGTDRWSPYVTSVIDDCLNMSSSEGRRWAIGIEVIAKLYSEEFKRRLGLNEKQVIDGKSGEPISDIDSMGTAEDAVINSFNRYARETGVKLRNLLSELDMLPFIEWDALEKLRQEGALDSVRVAKELCSWSTREYDDHRSLHRVVTEIRRILQLTTSTKKTDKQVNREATGGKSQMPSWVLPEDIPPAWASFLEQNFPDQVSATGSIAVGKRAVQFRRARWPQCSTCSEAMSIGVWGPFCQDCGHDEAKGDPVETWYVRVADEDGHYSPDWKAVKPLDLKDVEFGIADVIDIHDLTVYVWEQWFDLDEITWV